MVVRQNEVIARLKAGETLIVVHPVGADGGFQYLSGGGRVSAATFKRLTETDAALTPLSPGLFPDADPQEWGWADEG